MKRIAASTISIIFFLVSCSPKQSNTDTIGTQVAQAVRMTAEAYTKTPEATSTPLPTNTPEVSVIFDNSPQSKEGTILGDEGWYNFPTIEIYEITTEKQIDYSEPEEGKVFVIIKMKILNSGGIGTYSDYKFLVISDEGIMLDPVNYGYLDCELEWRTKVIDGATLDTCVIFEIKPNSTFTLLYAPYENDRYNPERCHQWEITLQ